MSSLVTPQEVAALARTLLAKLRAHPVQGIVVSRCARLVSIIDALGGGAYPTDEDRLIALSLVPYTFQEANYDDIDWCEREASKLLHQPAECDPRRIAAEPVGAAALTLSGGGNYAIHGTNNPGSIGGFVSYGCIRMYNQDIVDLYGRVGVGTPVIVTR